MYQGHVESEKRVNLLFDAVTHHYHVIANLTGAMAKRYICEGCNKGCKNGVVYTCEQTCGDCMVHPPCKYAGPRITCDICNRHFRSLTCSDNHKKKTRAKRKSSCELRKCCGTCGAVITRNTHECNKRFYTTQKENKEAGHLCFVHPLVKVPASSERVLYVIYDFETTHDTKRSDTTNEHVPNLDCCNNSVLNARTWQIYDRIAFSAAHAYTRSGTILWEIR